MRRPFLFGLATSLLLLGGVTIYHLFSREEPVEQAGRKCLHYIETGNSRALLRYISDEEKKALNLDHQKFEAIVQFFKRRLQGFTPKGEVKITKHSHSDFTFYRTLTHPNGRRAVIGVSVCRTDKGPRIITATSSLINQALNTYVPEESKDRDPDENELYALSKALPELERLPIPGYLVISDYSPYKLEVIPWKKLLERKTTRWMESRGRRENKQGTDLHYTSEGKG